MKSQQDAARVMARLGLTGLAAGLFSISGGCASSGPGASVQWDHMLHEQTRNEAKAWTPGDFTWPPDNWMSQPLARFYGPDSPR